MRSKDKKKEFESKLEEGAEKFVKLAEKHFRELGLKEESIKNLKEFLKERWKSGMRKAFLAYPVQR